MLDLGRYEEASSLLARVVSAEPDSSRAWCLFARAHLGADRYAEAVEAANRAAAIEPAEEWPHRLASNALMHLGNHAEALRAASESRRLAPSYWQTHVCVAQAALAATQPVVAAAAAAEARRLAPNEPDVHFLSGKVALARGDLAGAREHQERALALDPAHSGAMNELGRIRLRRHDTVGAIRHFINAARTTPGEHIYSRNIDVVILRTVSRIIYVFVLIALLMLWVPAVMHVDRFPFVLGFAAARRRDGGELPGDDAAAAPRGPDAGPADAAHPPGRDRARGGRRRRGRRVRGGHLRPARRASADAPGRHHRHDRRPDTRYRPAPLPCWQKLVRRNQPGSPARRDCWRARGVGAYHVPLSPRGPWSRLRRLCSDVNHYTRKASRKQTLRLGVRAPVPRVP